MPNLIFKVKNYCNEDAIENLAGYIIKSKYLEYGGYTGCFSSPGQDIIEAISNSFNAVKNVYYKNNRQMAQHIIIGFKENERVTEDDAANVACAISQYFYTIGYQTFWGTHFGSDNSDSYRHIHVMVNTVGIRNGLRYSVTYDNMHDLGEFLERMYPGTSWNYYETESYYKE